MNVRQFFSVIFSHRPWRFVPSGVVFLDFWSVGSGGLLFGGGGRATTQKYWWSKCQLWFLLIFIDFSSFFNVFGGMPNFLCSFFCSRCQFELLWCPQCSAWRPSCHVSVKTKERGDLRDCIHMFNKSTFISSKVIILVFHNCEQRFR